MQTERSFFRKFILGGCLVLAFSGCNGQIKTGYQPRVDRPMAAAGSFYPANPNELRQTLEELFTKAETKKTDHVVAIICPHAGYVFSGAIAASSYNQVNPNTPIENVFIIGSSHHVAFMGASIYTNGNYQTPLGTVPVNFDIANKLIKENAVFSFNPQADLEEHSIEVQVPFLQYHLKKPFKIIPIVIGTQSEQSCRKIAQALRPYLNEKNLFVISTDFSHYPPYKDAITNDKATCDAIVSNSPDELLKVIRDNEAKNITNLATSCCGWTSVLTLLYMTSSDPGYVFKPIRYQNSGDSEYGEKSQVVGYWSIAVTHSEIKQKKEMNFDLTPQEKKILLGIARSTVNQYIRDKKIPAVDTTAFTPDLSIRAGAFVTLKENGELRGCIGNFTSDLPLYRLIQEMSVASSTEDYRFSPVTADEIDKLEIEISVLSPMKKINSIDEIVMGRDGIYIKKGMRSGTFLPQVATETGWSKEDFLGHCSRDKAGIGWDGWKDAEIYTYQALVFSEKEISVRTK